MTNENLTLAERVAWAKWLIEHLSEATLDARYPDWYDWQDFLANGTSAHAAHVGKPAQTALEWLAANPKGERDLDDFISRVDIDWTHSA